MEAFEIAQKLAYAQTNELVGEIVGRSVQFGEYVGETVHDDTFFNRVQAYCLLSVGEKEAEHIEVATEPGLLQQFRAECQHPAAGTHLIIQFGLHHLPRSEGEQGVGSITDLLPVFDQCSEISLHQHDAVHPEVYRVEEAQVRPGQLAHCHQRMGAVLMKN